MAEHRIKGGLTLPITGEPEQVIDAQAGATKKVAVVAADYIGVKPRMLIKEGDTVKRGQQLFEDRKNPGVFFTAPGAGTVEAINRGAKRALLTVVIALNEREQQGKPSDDDHATFASFASKDPEHLDGDAVQALLLESGAWTGLRGRPFGRIPAPKDGNGHRAKPHAIFVTAADSNPLAPSVDVVLKGQEDAFERGLLAVAKLTDGKTYLCRRAGSKVQAGRAGGVVSVEDFAGKHPAGNVGVHIHTLAPVSRARSVWHLHYQDVVAIGHLFQSGRVEPRRVVALAGPSVKVPRLVATRAGANLGSLTQGQLVPGDNRVISGSVLAGRKSDGEALDYLGPYALQISALPEDRERVFLGWLTPGKERFSTLRLYLSKLMPGKKFRFTTTTNGSVRAMVPIGMYERVIAMDLMPTFLLRSLVMGDLERAEQLGALELDEEDLALCTFVCPGKVEYGPLLRKNLEQIWKEG